MWSNLVAPIRNFLWGALQQLPLASVGAPIRSNLEGSSSLELLQELMGTTRGALNGSSQILPGYS